jgi:hypothetical protein
VYAFAYDREASTLVGVTGGEACSDADYQRIIDSTAQLWAQVSAAPFASFILVIDPGQDAPSPRWRQRIAAARPKTQPFRTVIVTSSIVARGVLTAINWLRPPAVGQKIISLSTFEEAVDWLEAEGLRPCPILHTLYAKAREQVHAEQQVAPGLTSASRLRAFPHEAPPKKASGGDP